MVKEVINALKYVIFTKYKIMIKYLRNCIDFRLTYIVLSIRTLIQGNAKSRKN